MKTYNHADVTFTMKDGQTYTADVVAWDHWMGQRSERLTRDEVIMVGKRKLRLRQENIVKTKVRSIS